MRDFEPTIQIARTGRAGQARDDDRSWPARRVFSHCSGACNQGRMPCVTPEACRIPEWARDEPRRSAMTTAQAIALVLMLLISGGVSLALVYVAAKAIAGGF
jgi:hypothetical protein